MSKGIGQLKPEIAAPDELGVLELKANLNSEQRAHLEVLKDKMKKTLSGKTKQELAEAGDLATLKKYKHILIEILSFLRTKEKNLEDSFDLEKQYDEQFETLKEAGVIRELSDGSWGIIDILNREQPIPSYDEIRKRIEAKADILEQKEDQGFAQLIIVPFGMKLDDLFKITGNFILKKYKEGNLLNLDGKPLKLNAEAPFYIEKKYRNSDIDGSLVYYPQRFIRDNHGGKTKTELISDKDENDLSPAWGIKLIRNLPYAKSAKENELIKGEFFAMKENKLGLNPWQYVETIQNNPEYAHEQFVTPEEELIYFLHYLQQNNQVIESQKDSWQGASRWLLGSYFKGWTSKSTEVPKINWDCVRNQLVLVGWKPSTRVIEALAQTSVKF